jgi:hypothetical protein
MIYNMAGIEEAEFDYLMDPTVPVTEHAVLTIGEEVVVTGVDGSLGVVFADGQEETLLMIPPGEHTLTVSYFDASLNYYNGGTSYNLTQTKSDDVTLSGTFLPGHFYWIDYGVSGGAISFRLNDETNPEIYAEKSAQNAAKKRNDAAKKELLAAAKSPAKSPREISVSTEPTKFEGTWAWQVQGKETLHIFAGNTLTLTDNSKVISKGTFKFTENKLLFNVTRPSKATLEFDYSFNPGGTLTLDLYGQKMILSKTSSNTTSSAGNDGFNISVKKAVSLADHVLEMTPEQLKAYLEPHGLKDLSDPGEEPYFMTSSGYPHKLILGTLYQFNDGVVYMVTCVFAADNMSALLSTLIGELIQLYGDPESKNSPGFEGRVYGWTAPSGNQDKVLLLLIGRERKDDVDVITLNVQVADK